VRLAQQAGRAPRGRLGRQGRRERQGRRGLTEGQGRLEWQGHPGRPGHPVCRVPLGRWVTQVHRDLTAEWEGQERLEELVLPV